MRPLTDQQQKILAFVEEHSRWHGFPPTLREIGQAVGLANISAVHGHISALAKKGYIARDPDKARSIRVMHSPSTLSRLKRRLHEVARTDVDVLHRVVYGLVLTCRKGRRHFAGPGADWIAHAIDRLCVEHGWKALDLRIEPDHLVLVLEVWPNHSPLQTVRRVRLAGETVRRAHRRELPGRRLWARGFAVTTDLPILDDLAAQFLQRTAQTKGTPA